MNIKVIAYVSLKGGTGKSSLTILTANYAAALGKKVLVIDLDLQNSTSFYYHPEDDLDPRCSAAIALQFGSFTECIIKTSRTGIDLLPSSLNLADIRTIAENRLSSLLPQVKDDYDLVIIDTPPTYDNLVINAIKAADIILTPVNTSKFDVKSALFVRDKIEVDIPEKCGVWRPIVNNLDRSKLGAEGKKSFTREYLELINAYLPECAVYQIPSRIDIKKSIDSNKDITLPKNNIFSAAFYAHMTAIMGEHEAPEVF
jgi:cellulose biosynthesis protein BcsQ